MFLSNTLNLLERATIDQMKTIAFENLSNQRPVFLNWTGNKIRVLDMNFKNPSQLTVGCIVIVAAEGYSCEPVFMRKEHVWREEGLHEINGTLRCMFRVDLKLKDDGSNVVTSKDLLILS